MIIKLQQAFKCPILFPWFWKVRPSLIPFFFLRINSINSRLYRAKSLPNQAPCLYNQEAGPSRATKGANSGQEKLPERRNQEQIWTPESVLCFDLWG